VNRVFEIFNQLQSTNSKIEKSKILTENSDNILFKETLKWLLNPFVVTGISDKKLSKTVAVLDNIIIGLTEWSEVMEYLSVNNTGRNEDIGIIQDFISYQPIEYQETYKQLITKSLKLGIDAKTVNSVYKDLVPTFSVQLGTPIDKCKLKPNEYIYISQKLNGCRCIYMDGKFYTRSGKEYTGLNHILADIGKADIYKDVVLDGELIRKNTDGVSDSENFQIGTGIANSKDIDKSCMEYVIFDVLLKDEFEKGYSEYNYSFRKKQLEHYKEQFQKLGITNIRVVPMWYDGTDHSEIQKWLDYAEENDYEGCIVNLDTPYFCKRVKSLMKVKCFYDVDIRCLRIEKGTGRNANTLGAIVCDFKGNEVNVGSGFTDEQRDYYYNNPDEIIGKIVTVKYKEVSKNKNGGESLQFPVFVCKRIDKDQESYN
jgi:DNA ligase 1